MLSGNYQPLCRNLNVLTHVQFKHLIGHSTSDGFTQFSVHTYHVLGLHQWCFFASLIGSSLNVLNQQSMDVL